MSGFFGADTFCDDFTGRVSGLFSRGVPDLDARRTDLQRVGAVSRQSLTAIFEDVVAGTAPEVDPVAPQ